MRRAPRAAARSTRRADAPARTPAAPRAPRSPLADIGKRLERGFEGLVGGAAMAFTGAVSAIGRLTGKEQAPRPLTERERTVLGDFYKGAIDLDKVRVVRGGYNTTLSVTGEPPIPRAIGNTIFWPTEGPYADKMDANGIKPAGEQIFVHEAAHTAQFQNAGPGATGNSLLSQARALFSSGNRNDAYDWRRRADAGVPWSELGAEEQAHLIDEAWGARVHQGGRFVRDGADYTDYLLRALEEARAGRGWR